MKVLIDGDIVAFRCAASAEGEEEAFIACGRAGALIEEIILAVGADSYEVWLSGDDNFRYKVYPEYKAHRRDAYRPKWERDCKDFMVRAWQANHSTGCEADDMLGVRATELGDESIIATIDKDLNMIPGWHYNFVKKEKYSVTEAEAIRFFYKQLITGDSTDNIKGIPGLGPKKADRLLDGLEGEAAYYKAVKDNYGSEEEMLMNGRCLWIWRKPGDIWKSAMA